MEASIVKAYIEVFDKEKEKKVTVPVVLGVRCELDDVPSSWSGHTVAQAENGQLVNIKPTTIFYSAQHDTISIRRPPSLKRYRSGSIMYNGVIGHGHPMCTNPVKNSMSIAHFKRTHNPSFVSMVLEAVQNCLDS